MASLTDFAAEQVLGWLTGQSVVEPTTPLMVALLTVSGTDVAAGTEVTGGGYVRQQFIPNVPSTSTGGATTVKNATVIRFNNMPDVTVNAFAVYDSSPTPIRWVYALLSTPRTFTLGDPAEFAVGDLVITGD
jgi:hypothetical protein